MLYFLDFIFKELKILLKNKFQNVLGKTKKLKTNLI
tara:strand:- start:134 stop:241 length:108 start_codon:yes stop_codon:yes gene_type:complete